MNKKNFSIEQDISDTIERSFYIMKSYESLLSVLCKSYAEVPSEEFRSMIEDYRALYQKSCIEFSCIRDALFRHLMGGIPSRYRFNFDRLEVECEW